MNKPRVDKIQRQYEKFISESTRKNYKFYVFSRIMKRLFESYATVVSTENTTKLQSSARQWVNVQCRFVFSFGCNGSQLKNSDISGAIFTLSFIILILNSQCVEDARDARVL